MKQVFLFPGQWAHSDDPAEISTILGSCVGVALFDSRRRAAGLNHYLLPDQPAGEAPSPRYGSTAIAALYEAMVSGGSTSRQLQAKVFGGASVLGGVTIGDGIGQRNIAQALATLERLRIPVVEQNVGGTRGRRIKLHTETFEVTHLVEGQEREALDVTGLNVAKPKIRPRVVIVDDSATVRSLFQKIFSKHGIEVVGVAANAFEARELIVKQKPDAITLDLEMPGMNGVVFLEKLMRHMPMPVVIVSSLGSQGDAALRTLELGAIEFVQKPSQYDPEILRQLGESLVEKVKAAASVLPRKAKAPGAPRAAAPAISKKASELRAIAIGGNAGSPDGLRLVLEGLPQDTPPVLVADGTIVAFLEPFLAKLKDRVKVHLSVATHGAALRRGHVYFAPAGHHLLVRGSETDAQLELKAQAPVNGQLPSSSVLFESAAHVFGPSLNAVLLSGFGADGVSGLEKVKAAGGVTFVEDPAVAAFPYAPQNAVAIGVVDRVLAAGEIAAALMVSRNERVAA